MGEGEALSYLKQVDGWRLEGASITKDLRFRNFREALDLVVRVGEIAEEEGHHPDMLIHSWNRVRFTLSTHVIRGLSENDFILAAKINLALGV
ncbi:MAG: 4a-hydroxytetrahydrobiopterin dehydratase [Candidatus Geothermarchaeales archaeon]